jgi:beta-glucanase (GH16 family)
MLGLIPATSKLEKEENALIAEYERLVNYTDSPELARFYELYEKVNSSAFKQKKKEIESLTYNASEEHAREAEFLKLKKAKDIKLYFSTSSGTELKKSEETAVSKKLADFQELEKLVNSTEFKNKQKMKPVTFKDTPEYVKYGEYKKLKSDRDVKKKRDEAKVTLFEELKAFVNSAAFLEKKSMKPVTFKDTPEYQKLLEYNNLASSEEIKSYYKFQKSNEYSNYLKVKDSSRLKHYFELEAYLKSGEFLTKKEFLTDKKRFEKTDMFKELSEYKVLKSSENIKWYFDIKDSNKYDFLKARELTFSDEFESNKIDTGKWLTNYYWGEKLLKGRYSIESDLHAYTESENFELQHSVLRIITKPQKINSKVWHQENGFTNKEFAYSSGLINTGESFRQKYGIFEAKIKLSDSGARNAFWLKGEKITPHINVCRSGNHKVWFDLFASSKKEKKKSLRSKYLSDFYIFRLEWTAQSMIWKINGAEVMKQTSDLPDEPLFITLAGGVDKQVDALSSMEIDWVRAYKFRN